MFYFLAQNLLCKRQVEVGFIEIHLSVNEELIKGKGLESSRQERVTKIIADSKKGCVGI